MSNSVLPFGTSTYSRSSVAYPPGFPVQATHGDGWRIFVEGRDLLDMVMGLGSVILGHCNPRVDDAIRRQLSLGTAMSLGTKIEIEAAERVLRHFPDGYSLIWGVNGSDATTGAIRLARAITGRQVVVMTADGYHGFHDWCLADTHRGLGIPPYKHLVRLNAEGASPVRSDAHAPAAVIVEPDLHSDWLQAMREWCNDTGALLIFDEVMTWQRHPGFRAAVHYGVEPDLTCLGKSLGNGMPCSAIVGPADILKRFAPPAPNAFFSATWAGHPLSMAAVIATLDAMENFRGRSFLGPENLDGPSWLWDRAGELAATLVPKLTAMGHPAGINLQSHPWNRVHSPIGGAMSEFRRLMCHYGVLIYSAHNLSLAFTEPAMERLLEAWNNTLQSLISWQPPTEPITDSGIMRR